MFKSISKFFQKFFKKADAEERFDMMTKTPVPKLIVRLAIPSIFSMIVNSLYNLVDTYFVAKLGTSAAAGPGICMPVFQTIQAVSLMFAMGGASFAARSLGAKDLDSANRSVSTSFFLSVISGTIMGTLSLIFITPLMRFCGATETILPYSVNYATWVIIASPFFSATFVLNQAIRQEGNVALAVIGTMTGAVVNCFLDPLLMFVFDLGIVGAALATSISQFISFCILFSFVLRDRCVVKIRPRFFSPNKKIMTEILTVGAPNLFQTFLGSASMILLNTAAADAGGDVALASMSITGKITNMMTSAIMGFAQGFQPVCSYCYGAKIFSRIREGFKFCLTVCTSILVAIAIIGCIFAEPVVIAFRDDPEVVRIGALFLRMHLLVMPFLMAVMVGNMLFQACGKGKQAMVTSLMRQGFVFIPLILILPRILPADVQVFGISLRLFGVYLTPSIADWFTLVVTMVLVSKIFASFKKEEQEMIAAGKIPQ